MTEAKTIQVEYYALLRDERGCWRDIVVTSADTARQLYEELRSRFRFSLSWHQLAVAVNEEFQQWDTVLEAGDKVVFIPPVAGG